MRQLILTPTVAAFCGHLFFEPNIKNKPCFYFSLLLLNCLSSIYFINKPDIFISEPFGITILSTSKTSALKSIVFIVDCLKTSIK